MREVLHLHAGFNKTGSTAIQDYAFTHELGPQHTYFHAGMPNSSLLMTLAFDSRLTRSPGYHSRPLSPGGVQRLRHRARDRIKKIVMQIGTEHTILSAEDIGQLKPEDVADVYDLFSRFYKTIRVYIYIRPVKSRIESAFQECLKTRFRSLEETFPISFKKSVGTFDHIFGPDQVKLFKFSRDDFAGGSVVRHFLHEVGLPVPAEVPADANTSLSLPAVKLLYCYRKFFPGLQRGDGRRLRKLQTLEGDRFHFHSDLYRELLVSQEGDREWLEARAGFSIAEHVTTHDRIAIRTEDELTRILPPEQAFLDRQRVILARPPPRDNDARSIALGVRNL